MRCRFFHSSAPMITFADNPLDRAADKREDEAWLRERRATGRTIVLDAGRPLLHGHSLAFLPAADAQSPLFLGVRDDGEAIFAIERTDAGVDGEFHELRAVALTLPHEEAAIVAVAKSLFEWHARHGFCSHCGQPSEIVSAGWKRICPACRTEHFPRVDPVVIMLPIRGDSCLLGRQAAWPAKRMSALAGFLEPGESIEEACAREIKEEAQLTALRVRYLASQPWPFPSSLMIGLLVEVEGEGVADGVELEEVRWISREKARSVLDGTDPDVLPPAKFAIARLLLSAWVDQK
ncbi:MAG: diphosphatase [Acidobacteriota bacterium]|jgi:NAD+ diphosphatase|nr:diphosphatase [Acidobacteriota bacterium]